MPLVDRAALDIGVADGTSVIPAASQAIPIRYVATIYGTYPSIVFAKASSGITSAADLAARRSEFRASTAPPGSGSRRFSAPQA